jgi:hypothetical protein
MTDTITLWVQEHDDPAVTFVINSRNEMEQNFADLIDEANSDEETVKVYWPGDTEPTHYDPSRVLRMTDPVTWEIRFGYYCDTWTVIEMPLDLYLSDDDEAKVRFVAQAVGAE